MTIRDALGKSPGAPAVPYPPLEEELPAIRERAALALTDARRERQRLLGRLAEESRLRGWTVYRASGPRAALDYIRTLAASVGATMVVRSDQDVFHEVPVDGPLAANGVEVVAMTRASGLSAEDLSHHSARAQMGITGVDYAIAETGSVVLLPRRGLSRFVSLMPPIHVALVRPQEVLESLEDLFVTLRLAYHEGEGDMGSYLNIISGPSRTADIEQTLVIGVHGPKEAHMVILEGPPEEKPCQQG